MSTSASPRRVVQTLGIAALLALSGLPGRAAAGPSPSHAPVQAGNTTLYVADIQAGEAKNVPSFGLAGQEGFGDTEVAVQSLSDAAANVKLELTPKSGTTPAMWNAALGAHKTARFATRDEKGVAAGYFSGKLSANQPIAGITTLRWVSGAAAAYEAQAAAKSFILPLVSREVYGNSSIISARNADSSQPINTMTMSLFNPADGSVLIESEAKMEPGDTAGWDTANSPNIFGSGVLGSNSAGGGWLGAAWFSAEQPVTVMAYNDEAEANGSSAFLARPVSAAATLQYLPVVRANAGGDSLIAVANAGNKAVDVTITYRGAANSPAGANQTFTQQLALGPRGSAFVDLSTRQRGTKPSPTLPRAQGFLGSAVLSGTGPILAVAQEETMADGKVATLAAYNAFGPDDLGSEFAAPAVRKRVGSLSSSLVLYNPGDSAVQASVDFYNATDVPAGSANVNIPAGSFGSVALKDIAAFPVGQVGRATIRVAGNLAVLSYDARDLGEKPDEEPLVVRLRDIADARISGQATLTQKGSDLEIVIGLTGAPANVALGATVRTGKCGATIGVSYTLTSVADGKSTTLVKDLKLATLVAGQFAIVVQTPGGRTEPARDVACGEVQPATSLDALDSTAAWAIRTKAGGSVVTPGTPTSTPTATGTGTTPPPTPPTATTTPTTPGPGPTTPAVPTATATAGDGRVHVYLPWAKAR